jgi:hypothetical protein
LLEGWIVDERLDDQGGGRRTAADEAEERAEVAGGDEAGHEESLRAGLGIAAMCGGGGQGEAILLRALNTRN